LTHGFLVTIVAIRSFIVCRADQLLAGTVAVAVSGLIGCIKWKVEGCHFAASVMMISRDATFLLSRADAASICSYRCRDRDCLLGDVLAGGI